MELGNEKKNGIMSPEYLKGSEELFVVYDMLPSSKERRAFDLKEEGYTFTWIFV